MIDIVITYVKVTSIISNDAFLFTPSDVNISSFELLVGFLAGAATVAMAFAIAYIIRGDD